MRFVIFTHSLVSDWNHGNAHFLRGIATELIQRGHDVRVLEPADGWSRTHLLETAGAEAIPEFEHAYPLLRSTTYNEDSLDLNQELLGADVVLVHEWNSHDLVRRIGQHRKRDESYLLFFHDTHHRAATAPASMAAYELGHYDGVLAYGNVIRDLYLRNGWTRSAWTWHEAADTNVFRPMKNIAKVGDLVWVGNWGDGERTEELREFLIGPVKELKLSAKVYGVRYPEAAIEELQDAGIEYGGWVPNFRVPEVFARYKVTVHVPRRPYATALPGIPTIRPFEAMACGIPMVSAPWRDTEGLFTPGRDFLVARNGSEMTAQLDRVLANPSLAGETALHGFNTIRQRHTCSHRVDELLGIVSECRQAASVREHACA